MKKTALLFTLLFLPLLAAPLYADQVELVTGEILSGKIKRIDTSKAAALKGVRAIVTGEDCAGLKIGRRLYDMPILAEILPLNPTARSSGI